MCAYAKLEDVHFKGKTFIDQAINGSKMMDDYSSIRGMVPPLHDDDGRVTEENCRDMERIREINRQITKFNVTLRELKGSEECLKNFIEISKCLLSLLPPVSIKSTDLVFYVDDLLYEEQIKHEHKSLIEDRALYRHIEAIIYINCYITFMRMGIKNIFMDTALMGLMEHVPLIFQNWPYQHLLQSKDVYSTCVALKIILACARNQHIKFSFDTAERIYDDIQLRMEHLRKIPLGCSTDGRRISEFICYHADKFMNLTELNITVHGFEFIKASIVKMISERNYPANEHIVSLIDTFMNLNSSERDELPGYLFKLLQGTDESVQGALKLVRHRIDANKPNTLPQALMRIIFDHIITNTVYLGENLLKVEENIKSIDAVYGYKIEPYYPKNNEYKYRAFNGKASMRNEAFGFDKQLACFKEFQAQKLSHDDDIIFEKFFVYEEFMRSLHCLSIFHELFMELERRFEVVFPQSFVYSNFWNTVTTIGLVPWYVKMIVMKCPFLLKSSENKLIDMSFDDLTHEEKEFIDSQNWANSISGIAPGSYANRRFPRSSPVSLPVPQDYCVPDGLSFIEYLKKHNKLKMEGEEGVRFVCTENYYGEFKE